MKNNPSRKGQGVSTQLPFVSASSSFRASSKGVEILKDEKIGLDSSNNSCPTAALFDLSGTTNSSQIKKSSGHRSSYHHQSGFRSFDIQSRGRMTMRDHNRLFQSDEVEDSLLIMSSIDGVITQAGGIMPGFLTFQFQRYIPLGSSG